METFSNEGNKLKITKTVEAVEQYSLEDIQMKRVQLVNEKTRLDEQIAVYDAMLVEAGKLGIKEEMK